MNPVVHIGTHKTASSWFQKAFFPNVADSWVVPRREVRQSFLEPRAGSFDAGATRDRLLKMAAGRRLIMSEENLSGYPHNGGLGGLVPAMAAARIAVAFPDAQILVLLRRQPDAIAAGYRQYVRSGGTARAADYLSASQRDKGARRHWYKVPLFDLGQFDHAALLDHYAASVGRVRVHAFLYEAFAADPARVLAEIGAALDIAVPPTLAITRIVNPSVPVAALPFVRLMNRFTRASVLDKNPWVHVPGWNKQRLRIVNHLAQHRPATPATPSSILGAARVALIEHHFAAANTRLAREWHLPVHEHGYVLGDEAP